MLTRAAPAITRALGGVFNDQQTAAFLASIGQCAQPLQHRAGVSFAPGAFANSNGVGSSAGWNPADYPGLFPDAAGRGGDVEAPSPGGYRAGDWYSNFYGAPYFDLSTQFLATTNQYIAQNHYEGDTLVVNGPTSTTQLTTNNITTNNIDAGTLNGASLEPPPAGPQGDRGLDGAAGAPGQAFLFAFPFRLGQPAVDNGEQAAAALRLAAAAKQAVEELERKLARLHVKLTPHRVVTSVRFDADNCKVIAKKEPALTGKLVFRNP